ncbi:MAG: aminotransferase class I/II-fold pyridoxal phosphate-dependent enzyme [Alphaproteobacteria bacterium]|nr:aminotransferase class I/II-fold pyridoxal phosphate-dependent enzyme [Alphaproteobacteria bacterium]
MRSLDAFARTKLDALERRRLRRTLAETDRGDAMAARRADRPLISFCDNDYLGLSRDADVKAAACAAIGRYGAGAGASRLVTGNHPLYATLEAALARLKGSEAACVFGSGYLANVGIVPSLVGPDDLLLIDALAHASMHAGARLSGARVLTFAHNDVDHLARLLATHRAAHARCLVETEGVFSMDGDRAPLDAIAAIAAANDAWLLVDDAHGFGVLGDGRGAPFAFDPPVSVPLHMGTLSKAAGGYGGYLCASAAVVDLVKTRARSFIYTTGLPPSVIGAAIAAVARIATDRALTAAPLAKARVFTTRAGLAPAQSAIVPIVVGAPDDALAASEALAERGFLVTAIRPPTVPEGTARLRVTFSATHDDGDIARLAAAVRALGLAG